MFIRAIKTIVLGVAAVYVTRASKNHAKLLAVRAEARQQMDDLQTKMKELFPEVDQTDAEKSKQFMDYMNEYERVSKIYHKTF